MIYLDVTHTCKSPMNTGIQRVVRGIFRGLLAAAEPVTPVLWDLQLESYCILSRRERGFLERPFARAGTRAARAEPHRAANPVPFWSKFWRRRTHRRNRFDLAARLTGADALLMPEIFAESWRGWVSAFAARATGRRVGMFHDAIAWRRPDITPAANVRGYVDYMRTLAGFDAIVTPSQEAADDLRACWQTHESTGRNGKPSAISILGWPPDEQFGADAAPEAISSGAKDFRARPKVLCVGTFEPRKNHLALLAAAERLWREGLAFELILIGRTTRDFGARVVAEVERLRRSGWPLEWRRHVDDRALLAAYDECAFTVYPTLVEGFGLPIIESLRRGRPCICGRNGALGEVAAGGGCLTIDQTDNIALGDAMKQLLTDAALRGRLGAQGLARRFETWPGYLSKLLPLLQPGR